MSVEARPSKEIPESVFGVLLIQKTPMQDKEQPFLYEWLVHDRNGASMTGGSGSTVLELLEDIRTKWYVDVSSIARDIEHMASGDVIASYLQLSN